MLGEAEIRPDVAAPRTVHKLDDPPVLMAHEERRTPDPMRLEVDLPPCASGAPQLASAACNEQPGTLTLPGQSIVGVATPPPLAGPDEFMAQAHDTQQFPGGLAVLGSATPPSTGIALLQPADGPPTAPVHPNPMQDFVDSIQLPLGTPLLRTPPRVVPSSDADVAWVPRRSSRLATKSAFHDPQPERQVR